MVQLSKIRFSAIARKVRNYSISAFHSGACVLLFLAVSTVHATTWYVHPDSALNSIQTALGLCSDHDTVLVGPGTYYANIVWPGTQGILLMSELGPAVTLIDGGGITVNQCVIAVTSGVDSTTVIRGFTIQNGEGEGNGGGIVCWGSSPTIMGNTIISNYSWTGGGVVVCDSAAPIIINNTISNNFSYGGSGIGCVTYSSPRIINNVIAGNSSNEQGGGILCSHSSPTITDNQISNNWANYGGGGIMLIVCSASIAGNNICGNTVAGYGAGICANYTSAVIKNNTITSNTAYDVGMGYGGGGISIFLGDVCIASNTVAGNTGGGILCCGASPIIDSCNISGNSGTGISCSPHRQGTQSDPIINYNNINNNTGYGVQNTDSTIMINAENNWWGDQSGPSGFGPGTGDSVSQFVDFDPWLAVPVGVAEHKPYQIIANILQAYPNPLREYTNIKYSIPYRAMFVNLKIIDVLGRAVRTFPNSYAPTNQITWQGTDNNGNHLPSGVYFLRLESSAGIQTIPVVILR